MTDLTSLPASTTPAEFSALIQEALSGLEAPENAPADKAQFTVAGDGGGQWVMGVVEGKFLLAEGSADGPPLAVDLTVDDWRAFMLGTVRDAVKPHLPDPGSLDPTRLTGLYKHADKLEALKMIQGSLQLIVKTDDAAHSVTITTGGVAPNLDDPTARVTVTLADFVDLVAGKENPQQAFFSGKLLIEGDNALGHLMMMASQFMGG